MSNETQNSVPKYLSTPERIASELDSIRDRLMTRGIVSGERLYGCDEWSEPVIRLQKVIEALQAPAHDGEVAYLIADNGDDRLRMVSESEFYKWPNERVQFYTAPPRVVDDGMTKVFEVLKNYRDGRVHSNPHTRQVARDIAEKIKAALETE